MTTRRQRVCREQVSDWPIFSGLDLANELGVLSIDVDHSPNEEIDVLVRIAAQSFKVAFTDLFCSYQSHIFLVCANTPSRLTDSIQAYQANRENFWLGLEKAGLGAVGNNLFKIEARYSNNLSGWVGGAEMSPDDIVSAIEATRRQNAVLLITQNSSASLPSLVTATQSRLSKFEADMLVPLVVQQVHRSGNMVVRAYGAFDDATVGAEVFALDPLLDSLQALLPL